MQKYEKRILQCILAEKIIPMDLKHWPFFHVLKPEFIAQIHMVMVYSKIYLFFFLFIVLSFSLCDIIPYAMKIDDCGNGAIIATKDKNVYSLDDKEEYLKTGDLHTALYLREIKELCGKNIKTFAHSYSFILALTEEGEVYQSFIYIFLE